MPPTSKRHDAKTSTPKASAKRSTGAPAGGYAPTLSSGFRAATTRVQEMHHAIAGKTFDALKQVPGVSLPARAVQGAHDAVTDAVYAAVRAGGSAAFGVAGVAEAMAGASGRNPGSKERAVRSALNGVFGDHLAREGNGLAFELDFHADGVPVQLTSEFASGLRPRVCVFIHGLACDEHSWFRRSTDGVEVGSYGDRLSAERGVSALYIRYNTGRAVAQNAEDLAQKLGELLAAAPQVSEIALVGHSMGGLVARSACDLALADGAPWLERVSVLMCLGTPHQGAPLERLGHLASMALNLSNVTRPLAAIANARSRGIKDLRHGLRAKADAMSVPVRLLAGHLADGEAGMAAAMMGALLGDGLVLPSSASDEQLSGDVRREELRGIGHMGLLNDPRVYEIVRRWWDETARG